MYLKYKHLLICYTRALTALELFLHISGKSHAQVSSTINMIKIVKILKNAGLLKIYLYIFYAKKK